MVKAGAMVLKAVVPGVPGNAMEQELLEEDLCRIGYHGLLENPWNLRREEMMAELMGEKDNWWEGTVRQALEWWTTAKWRKVYGFPRQGEGMATRTDQFAKGNFSPCMNPKTGLQSWIVRTERVGES